MIFHQYLHPAVASQPCVLPCDATGEALHVGLKEGGKGLQPHGVRQANKLEHVGGSAAIVRGHMPVLVETWGYLS